MIREKDPYFDLKDKRTYPKILNDEIKLISFNSNDSTLIGSASYKIQKYPADIDLYEQIKVCCSKDYAIEYFYLGIQSIVNTIRLRKNHWMIEVKCGVDERYDIENETDLSALLERSKREHLLTNNDYIDLVELFNGPKSKKNDEIITEIIRKYKIIRWSADQIQLGRQVRYGKTFNLKDCIDTYSPINIEVIAVVDNKFADISNFYVLMFHNKLTDKDVLINFPQEYLTDGRKFVIQGLKEGINKVLFSEINKDVFKGIKRMFSLARLTDDSKLFDKISHLISGPLAELSQIKSELATLHEILDFTDNLPWDIVYSQLDSIKWRLGGNMTLVSNLLDKIITIIDNILKNKNDKVYMKDSILDCKIMLLNFINEDSESYLESLGLYKHF